MTIGEDDLRTRDNEATSPGGGFYAFAPWYRYLTRTDSESVAAFHAELAGVLDGFIRLEFADDEYGDSRLHAVFVNPAGDAPVKVAFDWLAHEECCLIHMYSLVHFALRAHRVVMIDAPNAAIPIADMRRWLGRLLERTDTTSTQAIVVVNESSLLTNLSTGRVCHFERPNGGPVVVTT